MALLPDLAFAIILLTNLMVMVGGLRLAGVGQPAAPEAIIADSSNPPEGG